MKAIVGAVKSRWFFALIGLLLLCLLVWFVGPIIGVGEMRPLEGLIARVILVVLMLAVWAGALALSRFRAARAAKALATGIAETKTAAGRAEAASAEDVAALQSRLDEAIALLKTA